MIVNIASYIIMYIRTMYICSYCTVYADTLHIRMHKCTIFTSYFKVILYAFLIETLAYDTMAGLAMIHFKCTISKNATD